MLRHLQTQFLQLTPVIVVVFEAFAADSLPPPALAVGTIGIIRVMIRLACAVQLGVEVLGLLTVLGV